MQLETPQPKPIKLIWPERKKIRLVCNARKNVPTKHLDKDIAFISTQVEFDGLRRIGKIIHDQNRLTIELAQKSQNAMICGIEKLDRSVAENWSALADCQNTSDPVEQRVFGSLLRKNVDCGIAVNGVLN